MCCLFRNGVTISITKSMCLEIESGTSLFITNFLGPSHGLVDNIDKFDSTKCNIITNPATTYQKFLEHARVPLS